MIDDNHHIKRKMLKWGTYGKKGDEPLELILISNISNEHLYNIINHVKINITHFGHTVLKIMTDERDYRLINNIFVDDYKNNKEISINKLYRILDL